MNNNGTDTCNDLHQARDLNDIVQNGVCNARECLAIYYDGTNEQWHNIGSRYLAYALDEALKSRFYGQRVNDEFKAKNIAPEERILRYPSLTKNEYWNCAEELKLPDYDQLTAYRFHTSGTELGVPTEQPWDQWTFTRSFCESSAIALSRCGVQSRSGIIIGSPSFGALARSYIWAANLLGLDFIADDYAFGGESDFSRITDFARQPHVDTLVATPGGTATFIQRVEESGIDPASLGIKRVISGVGNFLTARHLALIVNKINPDIVIEQGGKNEILHAPGAVRYDRINPSAICEQGYLHYLPYVSYITSVDQKKFNEGKVIPIPDGEQGILMMSRLTAGKPGVVAYINDVSDLGMVKRYPYGGNNVCACGSSLPAFKFLGRRGGSISNKLGDTLFVEEFDLALSTACKHIGLPADAAVKIRFQVVLLRPQDERLADILCWVLGVDRDVWNSYPDEIHRLKNNFIKYWVGYENYKDGKFSRYMTIGQGYLVDLSAFPHAGRDKPKYALSALMEFNENESINSVMTRHITECLHTSVLI